MNIDDYRQGLLDAIAEIDAEMTCVGMEYGDAPSCARAARRVLSNAKQLILDKLEIESANGTLLTTSPQPVSV